MVNQPYYHFVMFGNEGLEGYQVVRSENKISADTLNAMELRARFNSQRNIRGYAFKTEISIDPKSITKDFLETHAIKIF